MKASYHLAPHAAVVMTKLDLSKLPRVDRVREHSALAEAKRRLGEAVVTELARLAIDDARSTVRAGGPMPSLEMVAERAAARAAERLAARVRRVINATGVVLHTNLGRAPLSTSAVQALSESAGGYSSIELDLTSGRRGRRGAFAEEALCALSGAEAALVVNNCAAAVLLALAVVLNAPRDLAASRTVATGRVGARPVLVSRGELIEIGGGFRVPDVLEQSGARLLEVGTTNKTHLRDYERALDENPDAAAILRVHQGNFRQSGFVTRPTLRELGALAAARGVPLVKDLGGGALVDLSPDGLGREPTVRSCTEAGAHMVCFSTDKVLGGPQGGALVGAHSWIELARKNALARALRLGRLPLVALEATLACYLEGRLDDVPALRAVRLPLAEVLARADRWAAALQERGVEATAGKTEAAVGGGTLADEALPSAGVVIQIDHVDALAAALRRGEPPVMGRIQDGALWLDARTVLPDEEQSLIAAVADAVRGLAASQ